MKKAALVICIMVSILFTGCWDKIELEELGYVAAIGVDLKEDGRISVTYQIQNPQVGSTKRGSADNEPPSEIVTLDAADILSARDTSGANVARRIDFSQAKVIIIGESFAKSEGCFENLSELIRDRQLRSEITMVVCREKAVDFIRRNKPPMETRPMKFYDLMVRRWRETGLSPLADLHLFAQRTERDQSLFLAIYATADVNYKKELKEEDRYLPGEIYLKSDNPTQIIGSAVFKEGKMIGSLTGEETRIVWNLRPETRLSGVIVTYKDPLDERYRVTARMYKVKRPQIKINITGEKPRVDVNLEIQYDIISIPSHVDYVEDLKKQEILKKSIETQLMEKYNDLLERTQKEFKAEPFNWGPIAAAEFWTYEELRRYDWMKRYPDAEINVDIDLRLKGFGKELRPSNLEKIRD